MRYCATAGSRPGPRYGFATYFHPGQGLDHWITEYRDDKDERWVKSIAAYVDGRMRDVQKGTRTVDTQSAAVLTALQVAEVLFAERREARELRRSIREKSQVLLDYLEREARV